MHIIFAVFLRRSSKFAFNSFPFLSYKTRRNDQFASDIVIPISRHFAGLQPHKKVIICMTTAYWVSLIITLHFRASSSQFLDNNPWGQNILYDLQSLRLCFTTKMLEHFTQCWKRSFVRNRSLRNANKLSIISWEFSKGRRSTLVIIIIEERAGGIRRQARFEGHKNLKTDFAVNWQNETFTKNGKQYAYNTHWKLFHDGSSYEWNMWVDCCFTYVFWERNIYVDFESHGHCSREMRA